MKIIIWIAAISWLFGIFNTSSKNISDTGNTNNKTINEVNTPKLISTGGQNASGPFFTTNQNKQPVLVWTEALPIADKAAQKEAKPEHVIKFAHLNSDGTAFDETKIVENSKGCRAHDESMNKIAFKKDGTIVAVFSKRTPHKDNRFAGALFYTQSFDGGNNWTDANYLHVGDTTLGLSRSFFDLATLPDGEVGAIWLDSRLTKERGDGSTLFFAKTNGRKGFIKDKPVAYHTCECCRTDLFVNDNTNNIHIAYRDIIQDTIRDMSHLVSKDNGKTFSKPKLISPDNWMINGCPHTGPAMDATAGNTIHFVWYTLGGGQGLYYNFMEDEKFSARQLLTEHGKHPQMLATGNGKLVFVWEEPAIKNASAVHSGHNNKASKAVGTTPTGNTSFIKAQVWQNNYPQYEHWVSLPGQVAEFPVVAKISDGFVGVAWVQNIGEDGFGVYYKRLKL